MTVAADRMRSALALSSLGLLAAIGCSDDPPADNTAAAVTPMTEASHEPLFPLEQGAHASASCASCHADAASFRPTCTNCHDHDRAIVDPLHASVAGYSYSDATCFDCHPRGTPDGPGFNHEPFFPIGATAVHTGIGCDSCHPSADDRTQFTCVACHEHAEPTMAPVHAVVDGYSWDSARCYACHPASSVPDVEPPADHELKFPIGPTSAHHGIGCSECHTSATDRTEVACIPCHEQGPTAQQHGSVNGYLYETQACRDCHPRGR